MEANASTKFISVTSGLLTVCIFFFYFAEFSNLASDYSVSDDMLSHNFSLYT